MKTLATSLIALALAGCASAPLPPPKPDANGEVAVTCSSSTAVVSLSDCSDKAKQACGGPVTELSRSFGPRLGSDVDIAARYRCTGP